MSPEEFYEETVLEFPGTWPRYSISDWESLCDGLRPNAERISNLLSRYINSSEFIVLLHSDPGVGITTSLKGAAEFIVEHFLQADMQVSDKTFGSFVEVSIIGVGTGWSECT